MTHTQVLQLCLIVGALCLCIGVLIATLYDYYRKGGYFQLQNWLDAEVEQGVKLLKENAELRAVCAPYEKMLIEHRDLCPVFHPELSQTRAVSFPAQESTSAGPDTALRAGGSSLEKSA